MMNEGRLLFPPDSNGSDEPQGRPSNESSNSKMENLEPGFYSRLENNYKEQMIAFHDSVILRIGDMLEEKLETFISSQAYAGQSVVRTQAGKFVKRDSEPVESQAGLDQKSEHLNQIIRETLINGEIWRHTYLITLNEQLSCSNLKLNQENEDLKRANQNLNERIRSCEEELKRLVEKSRHNKIEIKDLKEKIESLHELANRQGEALAGLASEGKLYHIAKFKELLHKNLQDVCEIKGKLEEMHERNLGEMNDLSFYRERVIEEEVGLSGNEGPKCLGWKDIEDIFNRQIEELKELESELDDMEDLDDMLMFFRERNMRGDDEGVFVTD